MTSAVWFVTRILDAMDLHSQANLETSTPCTTSLVISGSIGHCKAIICIPKNTLNDYMWQGDMEIHLYIFYIFNTN